MKTATIILILTVSIATNLHAQSAAERSPEVKAAIDGVLDLFQQKPVVVLCDDHGLL
jgi:ABC-type proline/glycine betaine transport system permease subunit